MRRILLFALLLPLLASQPAPRLTVLDYYRRLPIGTLPYLNQKPDVTDVANGYLLLRHSTGKNPVFSEVAVWRKPNGEALIGTNYQTGPAGPGCGDETCTSMTNFYTYRPVDAKETPQTSVMDSKNWRNVSEEVFFEVSAAVAKAVQQKAKAAGVADAAPFGSLNDNPTNYVLYFPRQGTSIRVELYTGPWESLDDRDRTVITYSVKSALRNTHVTLCWLRWQQGKFVAATQP